MSEIFSLQGILALLLGGLYGAIFGAIPGLTATLAIALFIPIAFFLDPAIALPAIIAISSVAIFAGDVGSTVARIPGTPASAAYFEKLFGLSRREGPLYSLGLSAMGSAVGGIIGALLLMLTASVIVSFARQFSSFEYFWIAVLGRDYIETSDERQSRVDHCGKLSCKYNKVPGRDRTESHRQIEQPAFFLDSARYGLDLHLSETRQHR